jgi:penicillin-binding protein 2
LNTHEERILPLHVPRKGLRTLALCSAVLAVFVMYLLQLMRMQIVDGEWYKQLVSRGETKEQTVDAARGEILDRYGRPLAINVTGYNIVLDRAFLPADRQNQIILDLCRLLEESGEAWIDNLPVTRTAPFRFVEGYEDRVERLKKNIGVQPSATASDLLYWMAERYGLQDFTPQEQRTIAGIRYEMEQRGFNVEVRYTFAEDISIATVSKVKEHSYVLEGVDVRESSTRQYVSGRVAPHIIGYTGPIYREEYETLKGKGYALNDTVGKAGVELQFEDTLRGQPGKRTITMNAEGDVIDAVTEVEPVPGNSIILTIDSAMQEVALSAMERQIAYLNATAKEGEGKEADAGAVVAIECKTGDILVAATYPSYDMETFRTAYPSLLTETQPLFNRALQGTYAAGSCFKPGVAVAGLAEGLIERDTVINCVHTYTRWQGYQPTCMGYHGRINVLDALRVSCNYFFYELGFQLDIGRINHYASQFGLGQPTGIELAESVGALSSPETKAQVTGEEWYPGDVVQSAIGQSYNRFTPLQLANYAATLANRGKRMEAHIVKSIESYNFDRTLYAAEPTVAEVVDAPAEAFETVVEGMVRVSRSGSASRDFGSYFVDVAAKTGTPQTHEFPNSVFIAFAPAEDPELAVAVVIEEGWQGYTGAPVAKEIFDQYFYSKNQQPAPQAYNELLP